MDINTLRGLATVFALIAFLSICFWAYSSRKKKDFDEAANLPFADEHTAGDSRMSDPEQSPSMNNKKGA